MNGLVLKLRASGIRPRTYDIVELIEIALDYELLDVCISFLVFLFFPFFFVLFTGSRCTDDVVG